MPFVSAILLRDGQRCMLTEFQRRHVEYPPLRLDEIRTVWCRVIDDDGRPLRRPGGKPYFTRLFLEVAECPHTRRAGRGPWGVRKQALWFFIAWDAEGAAVQMTRCRSRKAALALYNLPAEQLGVPGSRDTGALVILSERVQRKRTAHSTRSNGMEGAHA